MFTTTSDENQNSSIDSDGSPRKKKVKCKPGETLEEAQKRIDREKERRRVEKLLRYAYPRHRETYIYKKKLLPPDAMGSSVDLLSLKKEALR